MTDAATLATPAPRALDGLRRAVIDERDGPLPALLIALTVLAGVVDAISILALGHVFVAAMTGNLVFIGLGAAGAEGFAVSTCALALGGFVVGALAGGRACRAGRSHRGRALRNVLGIKLVLSAAVMLVAVLTADPLPRASRDTMVVLLAMSMGAQLAAIRYLKVPDLLTVVLTLTITGALTDRGLGPFHPVMVRRGLSVVAFAVGAMSAALLVLYVSLTAALALGLAIIVGAAIAAQVVSRSAAGWAAPR
ncbi:MAG: DUF1275 domain-containing protein [Solirubrobacterales bacterium]|nr:DUF1275 domain-containing protein [Solirubrobacterales bacterium]